jgi:hypothetical protein
MTAESGSQMDAGCRVDGSVGNNNNRLSVRLEYTLNFGGYKNRIATHVEGFTVYGLFVSRASVGG